LSGGGKLITTVLKASESELLTRIRRAVPSVWGKSRQAGVHFGIGDDAAVLQVKPGHELVASSDWFVEGSHFLRNMHPPESVGYKSLVRAASDLAAMGATPSCFLLNLALPANALGGWLDGYLRGLRRAARSCRILLVGGDLARSERIGVSVTVFGNVMKGRATLRSGARPGDLIHVSGTLGAACLGLKLLLNRSTVRGGGARSAHLYPPIRLELGAWLSRRRLPSAMMDISDGLSTDLARLCEASGVGAKLYADRIPRVGISERDRQRLRLPVDAALDFALHGGDDYELLFTVPPKLVSQVGKRRGHVALTCIGEITRSRRLELVGPSGRASPLVPKGWDHFRR